MKKIYILFIVLLINEFVNAQWQPTNGPFGSHINCIASTGKVVYAGTDGGDIYMSTNLGKNWLPLNSGLPNYNWISSLSVSGTVVIAGTHQGLFLLDLKNNKWSELLDNMDVNATLIDSTNIVINTGYKVLHSKDLGRSWTEMYIGSLGISRIYNITNFGSDIYINTNLGVFLSVNFENVWTKVNGFPGDFICSAASGNNYFVGTYSKGIYLSNDSGHSWNSINNGFPVGVMVASVTIAGGQIFAGTNFGLYQATIGDYKWRKVNNGIQSSGINSIAFCGNNIFAGTNRGVFLSIDSGNSWNAVNNGLSMPKVYTLAKHGSKILAGTNIGFFSTSDQGANWIDNNNGLQANATDIFCFAINGTNIYAGTNRGVFLSLDEGASWTPFNLGLETDIHTLLINGSTIFAGTDFGLFESGTDTSIWTQKGDLPKSALYSLLLSGNNMIAGFNGTPIHLSSDNGIHWGKVGFEIPLYYVFSIAGNGNNIFAGTHGGGIYSSQNNGSSWSHVYYSELDNNNINCIVTKEENIFVGAENGFYYSLDNGNNWNKNIESFNAFNVKSILCDDYLIFIGRNAAGIWKSNISEYTGTKDISNSYKINIYPNPAIDILTIETSTINDYYLHIYDIKGQELLNQKLTAKKTPIDIHKFPGGTYFVSCTNDKTFEMRKILKK